MTYGGWNPVSKGFSSGFTVPNFRTRMGEGMRQAGLWGLNQGLVGASAVKIAYAKGVMPFGRVFFRGIMANWLVCLAVWLAYAAKDVAGKILGILFPITMFVLSASEHSVANMYYIPAGILAKADPVVAAATQLKPEQLAALNWGALSTT